MPDLVESCVAVALTVAIPEAGTTDEAVNSPDVVIEPESADHVTAGLKLPVPETVAAHWLVLVACMLVGLHDTVTEVIVGGTLTVTTELPYFVESWVEVAEIVTVPALAGVNTPELLTVPTLVRLTDQVTEVLKLPVPVTVGVQVDVCVVRIEVGEQTTETEVMVGGTTTVTGAEPDLVESWVDVAVTVAVPDAEEVNRPADVTVPPVADQLTAEL